MSSSPICVVPPSIEVSKSVVASDAAAKDEPGQVIQLQRLAWDFANARNREGGVLNLYRAHKGRSAPVSEKALNLTRDDSFHREIYRPEGLVLAQSPPPTKLL